MRRAAFAVFPFPSPHLQEVSPGLRGTRAAWRWLAVLGATVAATVLVAGLTPGRFGSKQDWHVGPGAVLPVAAWGSVSRVLGADDPVFRAVPTGAALVAHNPRQRLLAVFSRSGIRVKSDELTLGLRVLGYGYGAQWRRSGMGRPVGHGNRVVYRAGSFTAWYENGPLGLEQGFTLGSRPKGRWSGGVTIALSLSGNARSAILDHGQAVTFSHGDTSLSYRGLVALDARGRELPAWLQVRGRELLLHVNDTGARYPLVIDPFIQQAKLTASDGAANDSFGFSVAVRGDTVVAAAPDATVNGNADAGAVYVFVKPQSGWANTTETAKLTASDAAAGDLLGDDNGVGSNGVGISGDTIVAGASGEYPAMTPGAVYVFVEPRGGWRSETQTAKLTASDGLIGNELGASVAISGGTVVAGAVNAIVNGNPDQGAVYVFTEPRGGWRSETQTAELTASDGAEGDDLGSSTGIYGDAVVAGAVGATVNGNREGAAYVFTEHPGGWRSETQTAKLTASDGAPQDGFGASVAIGTDTVAAGVYCATVSGNSCQGAAYVFTEPAAGWRSETQTAKLTASDGAAEDFFGSSVGIGHRTVVAGAPFATINNNAAQGAVYLFDEPKGGWSNETQTGKLTATDGAANDGLGLAVALSGRELIAGAPFATVNGNADEGVAYLFGAH
jgi:trimeric autotransporter adhesin